MRFILTPEQREFFRKHQYIEFEGLVSKEQAVELKKIASDLVAKRLGHASPSQAHLAHYDLWRDAEAIRKATQKLSVAHIASEIFNIAVLRIAFDQIISSSAPHFHSTVALNAISCIKPLAGGILFLLEDLPIHANVDTFPLPKRAGNALFISPALPIPWPSLCALEHFSCLLVVFAPSKSYYREEPQDVLSPAFKKMGYVYNEQLIDELHPLVYGKK